MIINNPKTILDILSKDITEVIFGFDPETETWVRVQYMSVQEILESNNSFHLVRFHSNSKEDSNFLIELLKTNYRRGIIEYT